MCKDCHHHNHEELHTCNCEGHHHEHEENESAWRTLLLMFISAALLVWGIVANPIGQYPWAVFVLAYLPIGLPIIKEATEEISHGEIFNEFTLMLLATFGAFAVGEYPEAVAVLLFYSIGEYFQDRAVGRARRDIQSLISLRPDKATIINQQGNKTQKAPEAVNVGDVIEVVVGERVPIDGTLLNERAFFDTAALTGEPEPRSIARGEEVKAGMIASGCVVRIKALRPYVESALQRILNMVEEAASRKSKAEMFIRKFARIYTPIVILLAVLVAVVPTLMDVNTWHVWLYRAMAFLVISCPCALVVSIPLAYFRGIGVASSHGILFKGGNYLDAVTRLSEVVFDKTGTLTTGQFCIDHTETIEGVSQDEMLAYVAAVERFSNHPIAKAIAENAQNVDVYTANSVEEMAGLGLKANIRGKEVLVGKEMLLSQNHIDIPQGYAQNNAFSFIYCAINRKFAGVIALTDQPRKDATEGIKALHQMLISTSLPMLKFFVTLYQICGSVMNTS